MFLIYKKKIGNICSYQVGNNEIYELFQSAWSGAAVEKEGKKDSADNRVFLVNELGQGELLNENLDVGEESSEKKQTELEAIVQYIDKVFEQQHCPRVPKPWLPSLPEKMVSPVQEIAPQDGLQLAFPLGMVDMSRKRVYLLPFVVSKQIKMS